MKNYHALILSLSLTLSLTACAATPPTVAADKAAQAVSDAAWQQVPKILARIVPPKFADRDFDITKFGAIGDGTTMNTKAFADAIAACNQSGGGRVIVPAGRFLTAPVHLKSDVNLHVTKEATILFSTNTAEYLPVVFTRYECTELMNYSPLIYALDQKNIAVTGEGTLDGQAGKDAWHVWLGQWRKDSDALVDMGNRGVPVAERVFGDGHRLRPSFVQPVRCQNVLIEGVKIINAPMWVVTPLYCTNVTISKVRVQTRGPNTDGCDPDSCTDVWIKDCSFDNGDDCIAIKSGRDVDGRRVNIASRNIVIQNCVFKAGHGGVTIGSETAGGVENVFAENCQFDSPDLDMALRFKTNPARGGYIRHAYIRNCLIKTSKFGIHVTMRYGSAGALHGDTKPEVSNIDIRDCTFENLTKRPVFIEGYSAEVPVQGITVTNCTFVQSKISGAMVTNALNVRLLGNHGSGMD